jgi:hypothetical protein
MRIRTLQFGWNWNLKITMGLKPDTNPKSDRSYEDKKNFRSEWVCEIDNLEPWRHLNLFSSLSAEQLFFRVLFALFGFNVNLCPLLIY